MAAEYVLTALQIFEQCGKEYTGAIHFDAIMEKLSNDSTNINECTFLKSYLDPNGINPEVNVMELAKAMNEFGDTQKVKFDLDDSFISKGGPLHDSDSGISTDGFHLLEELKYELREKTHLASQLRSRLDYTDQHHEEMLTAVTMERDSLKTQLNMLRNENTKLICVKEYEDTCSQLCAVEEERQKLERNLEIKTRQLKTLQDNMEQLENEKRTLQDQVTKSKEECHRINQMYANRQAALRDQNELLKTEYADLFAKYQDQEQIFNQTKKDKCILEIELKDLLNRSTDHRAPLNDTIEASCTEDQILSTLDALNVDSQFEQQQRLNEDVFLKQIDDKDYGRRTNMSLFDEIRLSISSNSHNIFEDTSDNIQESISFAQQHTQTDELDSESITCVDCENFKLQIDSLEKCLDQNSNTISDICSYLNKCENNLSTLEGVVHEGHRTNSQFKNVIDNLNSKSISLQSALEEQQTVLDTLSCVKCSTQSQTEFVNATVGTQASTPCQECDLYKRENTKQRGLKKILWSTVKFVIQLLAVGCFLMAILFLFKVSEYHYTARHCLQRRPPVPWSWITMHELLDMLFKVDYVGEVPM